MLISPLIREAERLDNRSLDALIANIISLRIRRSRPEISEARLLEKINKGLPISQVQQLRALKEKRQKRTLKEGERGELCTGGEKSEKGKVNSLKYLKLVANQRGRTVRELMNQ